MSKHHLILISQIEEDVQFFSTVASKIGFAYSQVGDAEDLGKILQIFPNSLVVWSAEHQALGASSGSKSSQLSIEDTLRKWIAPNRVFALSDKPLSRRPELFERTPFFQHQIYRRYPEPAAEIISRLFVATLSQGPIGIKRYFEPDAPSQILTLRRARHRGAAVKALHSFFEKKGLKSRIASRVAHATDELIMNAIYNAPHNADGIPIRKFLNRAEEYIFSKEEQVQVEVMANEKYVGVCVTDLFGMLDRDVILRIIGKNYRKRDFIARGTHQDAGLGIYGVVEMGLSLLFVSKPGSRTDAILLFPLASDFRGFREGFQFIAYLGKENFIKSGRGLLP